MKQPHVWVIEARYENGTWLAQWDCASTKAEARSMLDDWRGRNSPSEKFRIRKYVRSP